MSGELGAGIRRAARMPPHVLARKALGRIRRAAAARLRKRRDLREGTYLLAGERVAGELTRYFGLPSGETLRGLEAPLRALADRSRSHRFDLLGSGWVPVGHGTTCPGLEGHAFPPGEPVRPDADGAWLAARINRSNLPEARARWRLVDPDYAPIDWQLDLRSGFRWGEATWHGDIRFGRQRGADIKLPWELARLQHVPRLAWAYVLAGEARPGFAAKEAYAREFRNVALDFLATNPPRFGVNWHCTMDVAIRAVNLLVAYDLFRAAGVAWDREFADVFRRGVMEHGAFIAAHLEYDPAMRGNHYLADVAGLLFVSAYLPGTESTDAWLAFAVREIVREVGSQFHPEGSNFEASTAYHRLSAEMACYATALVLALPDGRAAGLRRVGGWQPEIGPPLRAGEIDRHAVPGRPDRDSPFPPWYWDRLIGMAEFTRALRKPDGRMPQIGDNDSGRFLKLAPPAAPSGEEIGREDPLDPGHLLGALHGLLGDAVPPPAVAAERLEAEIVGGLAADRGPVSPDPGRRGGTAGLDDPAVLSGLLRSALGSPPRHRQVVELPLPAGEAAGEVTAHAFREFGVYVLHSPGLYVALRCGSVGQAGFGGHAHNDQLSVEVQIEGRDVILDPGTYVYTPLPDRRNAYRSVRAHFAPRIGEAEPAPFDDGLFRLAETPGAECLHVSPRGIAARHDGFGKPVYRLVEIRPGRLRIVDWSPEASLLRQEDEPPPVSPAYGELSTRRPWPAGLRGENDSDGTTGASRGAESP